MGAFYHWVICALTLCCADACVCVCVCVRMCVCAHTRVHVHIYVCVCTHTSVCKKYGVFFFRFLSGWALLLVSSC